MKKTHSWTIHYPAIVCMSILFIAGTPLHQRDKREGKKEYSLENPKYDSMIVASVGTRKITAQEFLLNYEFGPAFPKRDKNSKLRYLNFMIYEKLLALDGYARGVDKTDDVQHAVAEITGDLATEELYKEDIVKHIKVSERVIQEGIRKDRRTLSVRWIYKRTADEMMRQYRLLNRGVSFDSLFHAQLSDSVTHDDRSMEITGFRLGLKNPFLAAVLDTLHMGSRSAIIHPPDGYYILQLTNASNTPLATESEIMKSHEDVERALVQHISDSLSDGYVNTVMQEHHPTIIRKVIDILQTHLAKNILSASKFSDWKLAERLATRWGSVEYVNPDGKQTLADFKQTGYTVNDFLKWYHAREENFHLSTGSAEALFTSLEQLVWRMVRDKLLTERAFKRGFQYNDVVKKQSRWWKDKIVYRRVREGLRDSIKVNDDLLRVFYREHQKEYKNDKGELLPFEKAKDDVAKAYYENELTKRSVHEILKLKETYNVTINEQVMNALYVDTENQPRAIDVYVAKKGGIFPRPAFPTIDYEWQSWN